MIKRANDSARIAEIEAGLIEDSSGDLVEVRLVVPRRVLQQQAPSPELVSQATSAEVLGVPKRRFLEIVRSPSYPGRVLKVGRLRLVRRTEFVAHLESLTDGRATVPESAGPRDAKARAVPGLLDRLGLEEL